MTYVCHWHFMSIFYGVFTGKCGKTMHFAIILSLLWHFVIFFDMFLSLTFFVHFLRYFLQFPGIFNHFSPILYNFIWRLKPIIWTLKMYKKGVQLAVFPKCSNSLVARASSRVKGLGLWWKGWVWVRSDWLNFFLVLSFFN